ncbi:MAG: T9SS type A sorting domain-containing protein [Saprospiraceae bacterium]
MTIHIQQFKGYETAGIYTYETIDPLTGCTDSVQLTLGVIPLGEGICLSGIENKNSNELNIYPNPARDEINIISGKSIEAVMLTTIDARNVLFSQYKINDTFAKIVLSENLSGGLYLITIISGGQRYYRKIIIL